MTTTYSGKAPCNGIEIYYETFGKPQNPSILLIMGLGAQCIQFSDYFINPLLEANYYVIRFDNRDIGLSTWMNNSWQRENPYSLADMANDILGLLDFLTIEKVHLLGISMGGMIAQEFTLAYPERVLTLTSVMSTGYMLNPAVVSLLQRPIVYGLPFLFKRTHVNTPFLNAEVSVNNYVSMYSRFVGTRFPYEADYFRNIFTEAIEGRKGQNPKAVYQQYCAIAASGSRLKKLGNIQVPTLILHGTEDPLVKPIHANIYAPLIPNAKLVWLEGIGHELPRKILPQLHSELFELLSHIAN